MKHNLLMDKLILPLMTLQWFMGFIIKNKHYN